jgi:hypothetical protein
MEFEIEQATEILNRTPAVMSALLRDLPGAWTMKNEGGESWSPFDIVGHLIHGEETDWIPRARHIFEHGETKAFVPFDRFAQLEKSKGKSINELLDTFARLRAGNLEVLKSLEITPAKLELKGKHPEFGTVTMGELLSTWVAHDLSHIAQTVRVMARQYKDAAGPWAAYLPLLGK